MKGKKLPNVWVLIMPGGRPASVSKTKFDFGDIGEEVRYTPAKPAKVCRWVRDEDSTFSTGCDRLGLNIHGLYCQKCGGKIKVKR